MASEAAGFAAFRCRLVAVRATAPQEGPSSAYPSGAAMAARGSSLRVEGKPHAADGLRELRQVDPDGSRTSRPTRTSQHRCHRPSTATIAALPVPRRWVDESASFSPTRKVKTRVLDRFTWEMQ
jgi:hypothetical protein